jgi:galactokinase
MPSSTELMQTASAASAAERVVALFQQAYGTTPTILGSAPGRVNLIGEHLDYNGGPVLPFAIDRRLWVAAAPGQGYAMASAETGPVPVERTEGPRRGDWSDYVMGVVGELRAEGIAVPGARLAIVSDIQPGAGLSSSAALSVAAGAALGGVVGRDLTPDLLADVAFRAEFDYVGVRCGRMDQTVVAHAVEGAAMLFDTATGQRRPCPFPFGVWVVPTGVDHTLADGGYNARRRECEEALARCRSRWPELPSLAALEPARLPEAMSLLPPLLGRRTRHVVTETARTREAARALGRGDLAEVGRLLVAGHRSLRDDFESSVAEADVLVEAAADLGAYGARLTGAGWGGSVVLLAPDDTGERVVEQVAEAFAGRFGRKPAAWRTKAAGGVRVEHLT